MAPNAGKSYLSKTKKEVEQKKSQTRGKRDEAGREWIINGSKC